MKFAAIIEYCADKNKIAEVRPVHRAYVNGLRDRGQVAVAGPFTDDSGALIIYEAASAEEVKQFIEGDPFHQHGIFVRYVLRPWNPVLGRRDLFPFA
jgi:uncharacterized protein